ncbi:MAG: hypothetical protein KC621_25105, partial [Myxococcales bacterium]|nr:hypothetical protein [Myxococcales bacterium]
MWRILALAALAAPASPEETFARVREAELQGRWEEVAAVCAELLVTWPEAAPAEPCRRRTAWLDRRRDADGGLAGFLALESVRRAGVAPASVRLDEVRTAPGISVVTAAEIAAWEAAQALEEGDGSHVLALLEATGTLPDEEQAVALR